MKTLIENTIEIYGMGHPDTKTVFHLLNTSAAEGATEEEIKTARENEAKNQVILNDIRFKSLATIAGRKLTVWFKYSEDNKEVEDKLSMSIPRGTAEEIKEFILQQIADYLK